jgi:secreted trypsin-like serine protease
MVKDTRVIAGTTAARGAWPWQILMMFDRQPGCGGSLISSDWVVTAAHCVFQRESMPYRFSVRVGEHDWFVREGSEVDIQVSQVLRHPMYNPRTFENDVALLRLSRPAQFNQYVQPICLASRDPPVGSNCVLTGWGKIQHPGQMFHLLQQVNLPVQSNRVCDAKNYRSIGIHVRPSMICGGDGGQTRRGGCHGDSGGPFVCNMGGRWELHGAVSHGSTTCDSWKAFTVFSRINYLKGWISQMTGVRF